MSEQTMSIRVVKAIRRLDPVRVENKAGLGTPDVNYVEGWIELKWLRQWPVRETTIVRLEHYTAQQRVWAMKRSRAGGNVWLLLEVKHEWLLFKGDVAAQALNKSTRAELYEAAFHVWINGLINEELIKCLSQS